MAVPGPADPTRSLSPSSLLEFAWAAARDAGVTRLADVTRLDRFGLPVWQAIRPMSRALSVHQGKGVSDDVARLGALLEAVESDAAERFDAPGPICRMGDLPQPDGILLEDFSADRNDPPDKDRPYRWSEAAHALSHQPIFVPFDVVSLDLTSHLSSLFDRSSNGIAAGASRDEAIAFALLEFIERDAVREWQSRGLLERMADTLALETVPFEWLREWRKRLAEGGAFVRFYRVPSVAEIPVIACEINDLDKEGHHYRAAQGKGCHPVPEVAIFRALAEALQARVTLIAGARDDLTPSHYAPPPPGAVSLAFGLPLPPEMQGVSYSDLKPGPVGGARIAEAIAAAGYPDIAIVDLLAAKQVSVVKVFVCGLGGAHRRRRSLR